MLLADDVHAEFDALVANEHRRPGDELAYLVLRFAAERAIEGILRIWRLAHAYSCPGLAGSQGSTLPPVTRTGQASRGGTEPTASRDGLRRIRACPSAKDVTLGTPVFSVPGPPSAEPVPFGDRTAVHDLVDQAEIPAFLGRHIGVALQLPFDRLDRLTGVADVDLVQPLSEGQGLARLDLDGGG